jgi:hypothetical protein
MIENTYKAVALLACLLPLQALAERAVSQSAKLSANGSVEVSNVAGQVTITAWDRDEVEVTGEVGYGQELEFESDGAERARIRVVERNGRHSRDHDDDDDHDYDYDEDDDEAEIVVRVPAGVRVRANTVSAGITVEDVKGELRLQSVSGDIEASMYSAAAEIGTISGTIWLKGHNERAELRLSIVSGGAEVRDVAGDITARTVSGDLEIRAGEVRRVRIDTTSGNVDMRATLAAGGRVEADSTSGDVRLTLCGKPSAEYDLSSFSGDIRGPGGRRGEARSEHGPTSELRFKVGDGDGLVRMNSLSGNIILLDC